MSQQPSIKKTYLEMWDGTEDGAVLSKLRMGNEGLGRDWHLQRC